MKNCIEYAIHMADMHDEYLTPNHLPAYIPFSAIRTYKNSLLKNDSLKEQLDQYERELILSTLSFCNFNKTNTASKLKISRQSLQMKIKKLNIECI